MPVETSVPLFPPLALALRTSRALLDGTLPRRGADGEPLPWTLSPDASLGLAYLTMRIDGERGQAPRPSPPPLASEGDDAWAAYLALVKRWQIERDGHLTGIFGSNDELIAAADAGLVATHAAVFVRRAGRTRFTTPGRSRVVQAVGDDTLDDRFDRSLTGQWIDDGLSAVAEHHGVRAAWAARVRLERLGLDAATRSGLSVGIDSLPELSLGSILDRARRKHAEVQEEFDDGLITDGERYNKIVDLWSEACEQSRRQARGRMARQSGDPLDGAHVLALLLGEGEPRRAERIERLVAIRLAARSSGELLEMPLLENLRGGLGAHVSFVTATEARHARLVEVRNERRAESLRDVVRRAIGEVRVVAEDCGSVRPFWALLGWRKMSDRPTAERVVGRTLADSLHWRGGGEEGSLIEREHRDRWIADGLFRAPIRSVVTCEARGGVCAVCLGRDDGWRPEVGDPVGRWATEAIVAGARELLGKRCSVPYLSWSASDGPAIASWSDGLVAIEQRDESSTVSHAFGGRVVLDGSVVLRLLDSRGDEVQREPLQRGDLLRVEEGESVRQGTVLVGREPRGIPLLAEVAGTVRWCDVSARERVEPLHGMASLIVERSANESGPPRLVIEHEGREQQVGWLDDGAVMRCKDGDQVVRGDLLASLVGDPRVRWDDWPLEEASELWALLRGRAPSAETVLSEVAGVVALESEEVIEWGRRSRRTHAVVVTPLDAQDRPVEALAHRHEMPEFRLVQVHDGDLVRAGDPLCHGERTPRQMLRFQGHAEAAGWMVERLLQLLARYGVKLRSAHAELVVRSMLVGRIIDPADSSWAPGEAVEWPEFFAQNRELEDAGRRPARAEPVVRSLARAGQSRCPPDRIA